ncbi:hypothetical protein CF319_g8377 [Tilletia indica]|nr:hypothetical protein CF319_g8377 [Tilletia indica]
MEQPRGSTSHSRNSITVSRGLWDEVINDVTKQLDSNGKVTVPRTLWDWCSDAISNTTGPVDEFSSIWNGVTPSNPSTTRPLPVSLHQAASLPPPATSVAAGSGPRPPQSNPFPRSHVAAQNKIDAAQKGRQILDDPIQSSKKQPSGKKLIQLLEDEVIFLPERLLDQHVPVHKPELLRLLSKRGYQARVHLPRFPGTGESILNTIKDAFLRQKKPLDLDKIEVEFACFTKKTWLKELPIALDQITPEEFEKYYAKAPCVLVPAVDPDELDPDFHHFKNEDVADGPISKAKKGKTKVDADEIDEDFGDADSSDQDEGLARPRPVPKNTTTLAARRRYRRRCRACCKSLLVDSDCDLEDVERAQEAHWTVCRVGDRNLDIQWITDSDEPDGSPIPNISDPSYDRNLSGIAEDFKTKLQRKLRKYPEHIFISSSASDEEDQPATTGAVKAEETDGFGGGDEEEDGFSCPCGEPDSADDLICCGACKTWVSAPSIEQNLSSLASNSD